MSTDVQYPAHDLWEEWTGEVREEIKAHMMKADSVYSVQVVMSMGRVNVSSQVVHGTYNMWHIFDRSS